MSARRILRARKSETVAAAATRVMRERAAANGRARDATATFVALKQQLEATEKALAVMLEWSAQMKRELDRAKPVAVVDYDYDPMVNLRGR